MEMGMEESDIFAERLAKRTHWQVTNLGVAWYGPPQYLVMLRKYGLKTRPRFALFGLFEGNDIYDISEYEKWKCCGAYYWYSSARRDLLRSYQTASIQSLHYLNRRIGNLLRGFPVEEPEEVDTQRSDLYLVRLELDGKKQLCVFGHTNDPRPPETLLTLNEWKTLKTLLKEFKEICNRNSIIPIVLFVPTKTHIYAKHSTGESQIPWLRIRNEQVAAAGNVEFAVKHLTQELGLRFITLTPLFESLADEGILLYYPFDSHWNSEGREAAASFVAEELLK
jgi:hypothetical protein